MKIDNPFKPAIFALCCLLLLTLLPGYTPGREFAKFPAPILNTSLALYHNFVVSGIYDPDQKSELAIASISNEISRIVALDRRISSEAKPDYGLELKEFMLNGGVKLDEVYFFFGSPRNFALLLCGHFSLEFFAGLFPRAEANDDSIKLRFGDQKSNTEFMMRVRSGQILFCPEPIFDEVNKRLENDENQLDQKFSAFSNMLKGRPALALEVDFASFIENLASTSVRIPESLQRLEHVRLIADNQLAKLQLSVPDEQSRAQIFEQISKNLDTISDRIGLSGSLNIRQNGRSIFIEADAGQEVERQLSQKFSALLMQFFLKKSFNQQIAAANNLRAFANE